MSKIEKHSGKTEQRDLFADTCGKIFCGIMTIGILALVTIFPLILHDAYFDVLKTKYQCYWIIVVSMLFISVVLGLMMAFIDFKEYQGNHVKKLISALHPRRWKETFGLPDGLVIGFWLAAAISTIQSDYVYESFWGNEGRYSGLFLLTMYLCFYFLVTRCWKPKGWLLEIFLISGLLICLFGITDYFKMDILGLKVRIKPGQENIFTSTMGNINSYTAYVAMILGLAAGLFATEKHCGRAVWYYILTVISMLAIVMGYSENAYLSLAALLGLMPLLYFQSKEGLWRYPLLLATFFSIIKFVAWLNVAYEGTVIGLESGLFDAIAGFRWLTFLIVLLCAIAAAVWYFGVRKNRARCWCRYAVIVWGIFVVLVILGVAFALYDANIAGHADRYGGAAGQYLVISDSWGTNRGYIWKRCLMFFDNFSVIRKLFGYGPDTFGIMTVNLIYQEMGTLTGQVFDTAHNEYLQYLVTIGAVGLVFYIAFLLAVIRKVAVNCKKNRYLSGILTAIVCYAIQALVNLNLPIVAPAFWLMLSVGIAICRNADSRTDL
ncbi:MAG: O-antigen ligase family protein [Clostridiales bacterium]|nr:O-antigen ligase family protein [Clostridiales bacterium]